MSSIIGDQRRALPMSSRHSSAIERMVTFGFISTQSMAGNGPLLIAPGSYLLGRIEEASSRRRRRDLRSPCLLG